jgi:hypothetical protein
MVVSMSAPRAVKAKGSKRTEKEIERGEASNSLPTQKKMKQGSASVMRK